MRRNVKEMVNISKCHFQKVFTVLVVFIVFIGSGIGLWGEGSLVIPEYELLKLQKFSEQPVPVPADGIQFKRDVASWRLEQGKIYLMQPTEKGIVTGMVFEGKGRFKMTIPDWVEQEQLQRCSGKKGIKEIDDTFSKMIFRTSDNSIKELINAPSGLSYSKKSMAKKRKEYWLEYAEKDIDARVTAGLYNPGDQYVWVEMKTKTFGWIAFVFDKFKQEEILIQKIEKKYRTMDTWISLDRESDRGKDGRPNSDYRNPLDVKHLDIKANITATSPNKLMSWGRQDKNVDSFSSTVCFVSTVEGKGHRVLTFQLKTKAQVVSVTNEKGHLLPFIRSKTTRTRGTRKRQLYDESLRILLNEPLTPGKIRKITVGYDLRFSNHVSGNSWYPVQEDFNDTYTVRLAARLFYKTDIIAVGKKLEEKFSGNIKESVWEIGMPTKIYAFTIGTGFDKESIKLEGVPEVISFGKERLSISGNMVKNVGIDVARSMKFYQWFFDFKFPGKVMYATYIDSDHGQAFQGFIHMGDFTFHEEHKGATELFRAHEVAHQLWGHQVGYKTYRDQWLSESFAEYSALLFIEIVMKEKKLFDEALGVYTEMLTGKLKSVFSYFYRPYITVFTTLKKRFRQKVGPIGIGTRASLGDVPLAHILQNYYKGPLVLHMMRVRMRNATGNDNMFRAVLKDFLHTYKGKNASTDDFRRIVEKHTKHDWKWFFDQWIHGNDIPTYRWNYKVGKKNGKGLYPVTFTVKQENVPDGFMMPVPVQVIMKNKQAKLFNMPIKKKEQSFTLQFPQKPKKVIFNPDFAVLARVKKL